MKNNFKNVVVIAPHPDDETLGLGGTIKRFVKSKVKVSILIVSGHLPPLYKKNDFNKTLSESKKVFDYFGVTDYQFLKIPATKVNELPSSALLPLNKTPSIIVSSFCVAGACAEDVVQLLSIIDCVKNKPIF